MTTSNIKRGRKPFSLNWPDGSFTVGSLSISLNRAISKVSIYKKINTALNKGELILIRRTKSPIGRPEAIYSKAQETKQDEAKAAPLVV